MEKKGTVAANKTFRPGWKLSLFTLLLLPLLLSLGTWQLSRAAEKRQLIEEFMQALGGLPQSVGLLEQAELGNFQRVRLSGVFGSEVFLIDNQVHDGQVGYWVVQVLHSDSPDLVEQGSNVESRTQHEDRRFLVNRGFVAAPARRDKLPQIPAMPDPVSLVAVVWPDTGLVPLWVEDIWQQQWPLRIQRMDIVRMAELTQAWPIEFRLEAGQPGVYQAAPMATSLDEEKHNGYAATWFGLALTLLVGFVVVGVRQARDI